MSISNASWMGFKELVLVDRVEECPGIVSFYFKDKNGEKLIKHKPGQFLPFKIKTDDSKYKDAIRTYSLSIVPNENMYRISVKKIDNGLISSYLHDKLNIGDSIEAMAPSGVFTIKKSSKNKPIVLISAGIGVTPLLSMLYEESKTRDDIYFVQAVQNSDIHPFKDDIKYISDDKGFKNTIFYSNPLDKDQEGIDYDFVGRVNTEWIKNNLPLDGDYYFCGPPPFMKGVEASLLELGVDKDSINYELFS